MIKPFKITILCIVIALIVFVLGLAIGNTKCERWWIAELKTRGLIKIESRQAGWKWVVKDTYDVENSHSR